MRKIIREAMKNLYLHIQEKKQLLKKKVMFLIIYCIQTNYASTLKHLKFLMKNHKVNHLDDFDLRQGKIVFSFGSQIRYYWEHL